ncbi:hypothetical protein FB451DRAFT_1387618 [Mycena latifolia]|nr:hypothetical protein FB451DRAFT_1387618 [Mycena latifolia]
MIPTRRGWSAAQRHVRSYASYHCLNSNDHCPTTASVPPVTVYSTRVEKLEKNAEAHTWVPTLRRLERLHESHRIRAEWWTETFDAVVLATGPYTAPHAMEREQYSVYHLQVYRHPERYADKPVLIVGASVSKSYSQRDSDAMPCFLSTPVFRRYITWLNTAPLEHGGSFVEPPPIENLEVLKYYMLVYLHNNTMNLDSIGNFDISMLSGQLGDKDPWDALVAGDDDW